MYCLKVFTLKNSLKKSSNLIHRTPYRLFGKSINRNQLLKIDRTLTRSDYKSTLPAMMNRWFSTTNALEKGSITKMSNNANPTGPMLAIRREDASIWERRSPLAPFHVFIVFFLIFEHFYFLIATTKIRKTHTQDN